jgi:hypothetical protein
MSCWFTCSSLTSMVTITCVSVCPHLYAGQHAAISAERAALRREPAHRPTLANVIKGKEASNLLKMHVI